MEYRTYREVKLEEVENLTEEDRGKIVLRCIGGFTMSTGNTVQDCIDTWNRLSGEDLNIENVIVRHPLLMVGDIVAELVI